MNEISSVIVMQDGIAHIAIGHVFVMLAIGAFLVAMFIGAFGAYDKDGGAAGRGAVLLLLSFLFAALAAITWAVEHVAVIR